MVKAGNPGLESGPGPREAADSMSSTWRSSNSYLDFSPAEIRGEASAFSASLRRAFKRPGSRPGEARSSGVPAGGRPRRRARFRRFDGQENGLRADGRGGPLSEHEVEVDRFLLDRRQAGGEFGPLDVFDDSRPKLPGRNEGFVAQGQGAGRIAFLFGAKAETEEGVGQREAGLQFRRRFESAGELGLGPSRVSGRPVGFPQIASIGGLELGNALGIGVRGGLEQIADGLMRTAQIDQDLSDSGPLIVLHQSGAWAVGKRGQGLAIKVQGPARRRGIPGFGEDPPMDVPEVVQARDGHHRRSEAPGDPNGLRIIVDRPGVAPERGVDPADGAEAEKEIPVVCQPSGLAQRFEETRQGPRIFSPREMMRADVEKRPEDLGPVVKGARGMRGPSR